MKLVNWVLVVVATLIIQGCASASFMDELMDQGDPWESNTSAFVTSARSTVLIRSRGIVQGSILDTELRKACARGVYVRLITAPGQTSLGTSCAQVVYSTEAGIEYSRARYVIDGSLIERGRVIAVSGPQVIHETQFQNYLVKTKIRN